MRLLSFNKSMISYKKSYVKHLLKISRCFFDVPERNDAMDRDMILRFEAGNQAIDAGGRYDFKIIAAEGFEASDYEFTSSVNAQCRTA